MSGIGFCQMIFAYGRSTINPDEKSSLKPYMFKNYTKLYVLQFFKGKQLNSLTFFWHPYYFTLLLYFPPSLKGPLSHFSYQITYTLPFPLYCSPPQPEPFSRFTTPWKRLKSEDMGSILSVYCLVNTACTPWQGAVDTCLCFHQRLKPNRVLCPQLTLLKAFLLFMFSD